VRSVRGVMTALVLGLAAAGVYALDADVRRAVYWTAAAVLTFVVTF
jgi:hypothetical protein